MAEQITVEALAKHVDQLAGMVAGLAAIVAHAPGLNLADQRTIKSVSAIALQLAPSSIQRSGLSAGSPSSAAAEIVQKLASISQSLEALRSAGQ